MRRSCWFAVGVVIAACGEGGSRTRLEYGAGTDIEAILRAHRVDVAVRDCRNPTTGGMVIRAVACTVTLTPAQLATLVAAVPLAPHAPGPAADAGSCETTAGFGSQEPGVEVLVGANTKVTNGARDLEAHVKRSTGETCIEIRYPWSG